MFNALIISDRACIKDLVNLFQPKIIGRIDVAEDFDRGLNEIFNKRPAAVFIQSEISGVFAETVTKHIKGLLAADSPKIILLWESAVTKIPGNGDFDDTLDLSLPEQQLILSFQKLLSTVPGIQWRTQSYVQGTTESVNSYPSIVLGRSKMTGLQTSPLNYELKASLLSEDEFSDNALDDDAHIQIFPFDLGNDDFPVSPLRPARQIKPWFKIIAVLFFFGFGIAIFSLFQYKLKDDKPLLPSATIIAPIRQIQAPVSSSSVQVNHTFTFTPRQTNDPAYTIKNPGWERHVDRNMEYLLFREHGVLKAIQIISMREKGITKEFLNSILREVTAGENFVVTSKSVRNGYDVQEGKAAGSTEIAIYTRHKTGIIIAVVISFS